MKQGHSCRDRQRNGLSHYIATCLRVTTLSLHFDSKDPALQAFPGIGLEGLEARAASRPILVGTIGHQILSLLDLDMVTVDAGIVHLISRVSIKGRRKVNNETMWLEDQA